MMSLPRSVSFYPWMICVLISFIEHSMHVVCYSKCYNEAEQASIPAAMMCYNNYVIGPRVVLDVFRSKESSTTDCDCTVTSDTPTKFNFSNFNNYHPGPGCGSTLLLKVNGNFAPENCYVEDMQLPSSNHTDTSVDIIINGPQSAISTDYCVLIESDVALNISCKGDSLSSLLPTQTVSTTETLETTTTPTKEASTQQTTSQTLLSTTEKLVTTSSIIVTTLSHSISSSTSHLIATTEEMDTSSTSSVSNFYTTSHQTIVTTGTSTVLATLETTSIIPDTTERETQSDFISSTQSSQTTTSDRQDTTTLMTTNSPLVSGVQDTTTIVPPQSSTESGAQYTTTTDTSRSSTASGDQQTTTTATTLPSNTNDIQTTSISTSTESSTINVTQHTTVSTALPLMSTHGIATTTSSSSVTQKTTTVIPIVKTTLRQATAEVPWNGIIPAILLGVILLAALLIAFIKWQRSREIKYPPDSSCSASIDSSNKYPPMGETNFGYDAYEADSGIVTEFSKSPEEVEIEYEDEGLDPKNLTKGPFIRYNVKDYSRNIDSVNYNGVRKQAPNGMEVYF